MPAKHQACTCLPWSQPLIGIQIKRAACVAPADFERVGSSALPSGETSIQTGFGKCVDLAEGNTWDGSHLHQWSCQHGNRNQVFLIQPAGDNWNKVTVPSPQQCGLAVIGNA